MTVDLETTVDPQWEMAALCVRERVVELYLAERERVWLALTGLRTQSEQLGSRCHFCNAGFQSAWDAELVFYGAQAPRVHQPTSIAAPSLFARGLLAHSICAMPGFSIPLKRLIPEGDEFSPMRDDSTLLGWMAILREFPWYDGDVEEDLCAGHDLAIELVDLNRRARNADARGTRTVSASLRSRVLERDSFTCRRCGDRDSKLVLDHIVPFSSGGRTTYENLQALCVPCNVGKGSRAPHPHDLREF